MPRVRLSPSASVTPTPQGALLRSDLGTFAIRGADVGAFLGAIVPLLDGSRDRDEIAGALEEFSPRSVLALLDLLEKKGLLEAAPEEDAPLDERWRGQEDYFRKWSRSPGPMMRSLAEARVLLVGLSPWGAAAAGELAAAGVGRIDVIDIAEAGELDPSPRGEALLKAMAEVSPWCRAAVAPLAWPCDDALDAGAGARRIASGIVAGGRDRIHLVIGAAPGDQVSLLRSLARFALAMDVTSLYGDLDAASGLIGPVVVPGKTACWSCAQNLHLARRGSAEPTPRAEPDPRPAAERAGCFTASSTMASLLGHLLALEAIKLLTGYTDSGLTGRILVQDFMSLETAVLAAVRAPGCQECGPEQASAPPAR
jgi:bacteriocin biosynthesis cyclodehydratase domain-containing protein